MLIIKNESPWSHSTGHISLSLLNICVDIISNTQQIHMDEYYVTKGLKDIVHTETKRTSV